MVKLAAGDVGNEKLVETDEGERKASLEGTSWHSCGVETTVVVWRLQLLMTMKTTTRKPSGTSSASVHMEE